MTEVGDIKKRLEEYLKVKYPQRHGLSIANIERMPVGLSFETYFVSITWKETQNQVTESLVIRMEPEYGCVPPYDIRRQYEALSRVHGTGIPVPRVHWLEMDCDILGRPFFAMEKMDGKDLYKTYFKHPEYQEQIKKDYTRVLAKIHGLDWQSLGLDVLGEVEHDRQHAESQIARWDWVVKQNQYTPQPVMTELISWLKRNVPPAERTTLCHGDYHSRNLFSHDGRVAAVLDWEMVGLGDPISDVAWSCIFMRVLKDFWNEKEFVRNYEQMAGIKVNKESLFFWKILSFVKLSAIGIAGIKACIESKEMDIRNSTWVMLVPLLQDAAARMLGF